MCFHSKKIIVVALAEPFYAFIQFSSNNKKSTLVFSFKGQTHKDKILVKGENKTILIARAKME